MLAFADPVDALAWCLSTQHALLTADWPAELDSYAATAVCMRPDVEGGCTAAPSKPAYLTRVCLALGWDLSIWDPLMQRELQARLMLLRLQLARALGGLVDLPAASAL